MRRACVKTGRICKLQSNSVKQYQDVKWGFTLFHFSAYTETTSCSSSQFLFLFPYPASFFSSFSLFIFLCCTYYFFQRHVIHHCLIGGKDINKGSSKSWVVCVYYIEFLCTVCQDWTIWTDLNLEIKLPPIPTDGAEVLSLAWFVVSLKSLEPNKSHFRQTIIYYLCPFQTLSCVFA